MTYEEIQNYPIGTIYKFGLTRHSVIGFWYNQNDRLILAKDNTLTDLHFYDNNTYTAIRLQKTDYKIDGWLFDGEEWYCVERIAGDRYEKIEEEELINEIKRGNVN